MTTTYADILDSAVKIGLGATISGFATYFLAKLNTKHDLSKSKRELLERISLAVQQSAGAVSKTMMLIQRLDKIAEDKRPASLVKTQDMFQKVIDEHNTAEGLAALLGSPQLTRGLKDYEAAALKLLDLIRVNPTDYAPQTEVIDEINRSREAISAAIHAAYEETAA